MKDIFANTMDLLSWILGGALFGLLILGIYNIYLEYETPATPTLELSPIKEESIKKNSTDKDFKDPESFNLNKLTLRPTTESDTSEANKSGKSGPDGASDTSRLKKTELPYKLRGTTTSSNKRFQTASLLHEENGKEKMLIQNDSWNELKILKIKDNEIIILNKNNQQKERLPLNKSSD